MGCGTTQIVTDDSTARIWANGQLIGRGHAQLQKTGMPETTSIRVQADDGREQVTTVKRSVTALTVLGALLTYGGCFIFCWEYPNMVWAALPPRLPGASERSKAPVRDPWLDPPPDWEEAGTSSAPPQGDRPVASPPGAEVPVLAPASAPPVAPAVAPDP